MIQNANNIIFGIIAAFRLLMPPHLLMPLSQLGGGGKRNRIAIAAPHLLMPPSPRLPPQGVARGALPRALTPSGSSEKVASYKVGVQVSVVYKWLTK